MAKAFQSNTFQSTYPSNEAFQGFERYVNISLVLVRGFLIIEVGPEMEDIALGDTVVIEVNIKDPVVTPPILFNPTSVQINIFNPDGTANVSLGAMSNVGTGIYRYTLQTTGAFATGAYYGNIKAVSGGNTAQTLNQVFFRLK